jgi:hypothetical protein
MGITVTADEADKKVQEMREKRKEITKRGGPSVQEELSERVLELDRTAIHNPDPHYAYRLANREHKGRVGVLKGLGYETVPVKDDAQLVVGVEQDGGQTHGDLVLMRTPIANYERRRANKRKIYEMQAGAHLETAKENINKIARDGGVAKAHSEAAFDDSSDR